MKRIFSGMSLPDKKMFIFGLDVAHPEIGQRDGLTPSCVGMACNSTDIPYSFLGDFAYTTPKQEAVCSSSFQMKSNH